MKRIIKIVFAVMLAFTLLIGCSSDGDSKDKKEKNTKLEKFEENDGLLTYIDTENSPFEESGLKITIKQEETGYAEFVKTDLKGNDTVDYYKFNYETNQMEKYYYVSAMGTGFYYYYDLDSKSLVKVEDMDHNDSTQSVKDAGRWDSAAEKTAAEAQSLEDYFSGQYKVSIKEAVTE